MRWLVAGLLPLTVLAATACDAGTSSQVKSLSAPLVAPVASAAPVVSAVPSSPSATVSAPSTASPAPTATDFTRTLIDAPYVPPMPRTLVFGDSLITRSRNQLEAQSKQISVAAFPGTSPCDWLTSGMFMRTIGADRPDAVVLAFIGNAMTPCMGKASGAALVSEYRADVAKMVRLARGQHVTRVVLVRPPAKQNDPSSQASIDAYTRGQDAQLCEAGRAVSLAEHVADGVHLTAVGSAEYAKAIVDCVLEP